MPADTLSIVIPTFQRTDLLRNCLRSVVCHAPAGAEIIVVADGSPGTDVSEFPGVRLLRLSRGSGFCAAANAGIAAATGAIVELLNDDTEVTAGWAEAAINCFGDPRVAAVAPLVLMSLSDRAIIDSAGDDYDFGGFAGKRGHGEPLSPPYLRRQEVFGASGSSAFYRRDLLLRVGGFPREFGALFRGRRSRLPPASNRWQNRVRAGIRGAAPRRLLLRPNESPFARTAIVQRGTGLVAKPVAAGCDSFIAAACRRSRRQGRPAIGRRDISIVDLRPNAGMVGNRRVPSASSAIV